MDQTNIEGFLDRRLTNESLRHSIALSRFTGVTLLNRETFELMLGWDHLRALDLTRKSAVHSALLLRKNFIQSGSHTTVAWAKPPFAVMVSSPVPPVCWGRAMRICFTLEAKRGQIYKLISALRKLNLYVRHIDSGDGLGLSDFQLVGPDLQRQDIKNIGDVRNTVRPTTIMTIEVPHQHTVQDNFKRQNAYPEKEKLLSSIHQYLDAWKSATPEPNYVLSLSLKATMVTELSSGLATYGCEGVRIEWVSPLQMLASLKDAMINMDPKTKTAEKARTTLQKLHKHVDGAISDQTVLKETQSLLDDLAEEIDQTGDKEEFVNSVVNMPVYTSTRMPENLCISLGCWKKLLDPSSRNNIERALSPGNSNIAAVLNVDKEERTLTAEFLSLQHYAVVQFELLFPSGRIDHRWKEWVLEEVSNARGGVMRAFTLGNLEGRWGRAIVIAWFPFSESAERECSGSGGSNNPPTDHIDEENSVPSVAAIERMIRCMRALKGLARLNEYDDTIHYDNDELTPYEKVHQYIPAERTILAKELLSEDEAEIATKRPFRSDTTLRDVKIWYRWPKSTSIEHRAKFVANPFNYTRPLHYKDHNKYYNQSIQDENMSRLRLARRIAQRFSDPRDGSVLLIGAHRSGKTSIMNMVLDIISNEHHEDEPRLLGFPNEDDLIVGIRINAAVTPAHQILLAITTELEHQIARMNSGIRAQAGKAAMLAKDAILQAASGLGSVISFALPENAELSLDALGVHVKTTHSWANENDRRWIKRKDKAVALKPEDLAQALSAQEKNNLWNSVEGQAALLRLSIECLRNAMQALNSDDDDKPKVTLVIAVDEIAESAAWGNTHAFPVWRHLVESNSFRHLRWLFSSTRPPAHSTGYSPLSNALREYLMRPLNHSEAYQLIDNFDMHSKPDYEPTEDGRIPLVVTYGAREFIAWATGRFPYLMQVLCVHVYERAVSDYIPIITTALVRKILEERVTPALTEYFSAQWQSLAPETQEELLRELCSNSHPLGKLGFELPNQNLALSPRVAREVQMAGLGGISTENPVVPLFAHWISQSNVKPPHSGEPQ